MFDLTENSQLVSQQRQPCHTQQHSNHFRTKSDLSSQQLKSSNHEKVHMITEKHLTFSDHSSEGRESKEMSHLSRRDLTCDVHDSDPNVFSGPAPTQYVFDQSSMPSQIN